MTDIVGIKVWYDRTHKQRARYYAKISFDMTDRVIKYFICFYMKLNGSNREYWLKRLEQSHDLALRHDTHLMCSGWFPHTANRSVELRVTPSKVWIVFTDDKKQQSEERVFEYEHFMQNIRNVQFTPESLFTTWINLAGVGPATASEHFNTMLKWIQRVDSSVTKEEVVDLLARFTGQEETIEITN